MGSLQQAGGGFVADKITPDFRRLLLLLLLLFLEVDFKRVKDLRLGDPRDLLRQLDVGFEDRLTKGVERHLQLVDVRMHALAENIGGSRKIQLRKKSARQLLAVVRVLSGRMAGNIVEHLIHHPYRESDGTREVG